MRLSVLFAESLDATGCVCLRLDNDGLISAASAFRTFDEIKVMQADSYTMVVVSAVTCGIYTVELPWLGERKARAAIPYALEEQLAQKIPTLHFAFDRAHHQNNRYLVVVVDKTYLADLMARLQEAEIRFNEVTLDWFALEMGEICLTPSALFVRTEAYQGALSGELIQKYEDEIIDSIHGMKFTDSLSDWTHPLLTEVEQPFFVWVAQRLQHMPHINLCQGELSHRLPDESVSRRWVVASLALAGLWLISVLGINVVNLIRLNHQLNLIDKDTAVVYREFFPNADRVISPRFRISHLMNTGDAMQGSLAIWQLLKKLDEAMDPKELTVEQLRYKDKMLSVMLKAEDFSALEALSARLKQAEVNVSQTQATSNDHKVSATMELRL